MTASAATHETTAKASAPAKEGTMRVYVGTYTTGGKSKGIYLLNLDMASGKLSLVSSGPQVESPSFLALHPNHRFLYAVNEVGNFEGAKTGAVSAFAIDPKTGGLTLLDQQSSEGDGPCHLSIDKHGKSVLVANYGGGSVSALPIQPDGRLGKATARIQHEGSSVDKNRQEGPHAHSIVLDASNHFAFVPDLGLDKIVLYRFDANDGSLVHNSVPAATVAPGSGPRHLAFHPNGHFAYVINEMASTVIAFHYDSKAGTLHEIQTISTLPADFQGHSSTAEVLVSPNGKFLYGSNRGHDSIALFSIDPQSGKLTAMGHQSTQGKTPRNFGIDPTGTFLLAANQDSDSIVVFRIDPQTGQLTPTGNTIEIPMPVCVVFVPNAH